MIFSMHILVKQVLNMKDNYYIHFFILSVLFDILTGNLKNMVGKNRNLDSSVGIKGLIKHVIVLLLVLTIYPVSNSIKLLCLCKLDCYILCF